MVVVLKSWDWQTPPPPSWDIIQKFPKIRFEGSLLVKLQKSMMIIMKVNLGDGVERNCDEAANIIEEGVNRWSCASCQII